MCSEFMPNSSTEEKLRPAERKVLLVRQGPRDWSQKCRGDFRIFISAVSGNYEFLKTKQMRVVHRGESTGASLQHNVKYSSLRWPKPLSSLTPSAEARILVTHQAIYDKRISSAALPQLTGAVASWAIYESRLYR